MNKEMSRRQFAKSGLVLLAAGTLLSQSAFASGNNTANSSSQADNKIEPQQKDKKMHIAMILFDNFETLDVYGPVEMFGMLPEQYEMEYYSMTGGLVKSRQNVRADTLPISELKADEFVLLIPGGTGTRTLVDDATFIAKMKELSEKAVHVLTVCTGSAILAKTGLLDGKKATGNKRAWKWVISQNDKVQWVGKARWVKDGKYYTSSGVSAGTDMALGYIEDIHGKEKALFAAKDSEYIWNSDKDNDPYAVEYNI